jgi:hypothetical protein
MTGIETMCMGKPFIFNHQMDWSIQIPGSDLGQIAQTIVLTYEQVVNGVYNNGFEATNYYLDRNSNRIFEKNLLGFFKLGLNHLKNLDSDKLLVVPSNKVCTSEHTWEYKLVLDPGIYNVQLMAKSSGYAHLCIVPNKKLTVISSKYSKIPNYETLSWIEFKVSEKIEVIIVLKLGYPQSNECIEIRSLMICN